ncbi:hypothetical protein QVD17_37258 [Tagetes erecta]|uniref:Uncharacterized protein n=1 Tax=Tagetes erecta TaxID=13708 RepID=A0AAD8NI60_TARER|nr:hypothetical protein QVD17_37258 [Tagetes erecta]
MMTSSPLPEQTNTFPFQFQFQFHTNNNSHLLSRSLSLTFDIFCLIISYIHHLPLLLVQQSIHFHLQSCFSSLKTPFTCPKSLLDRLFYLG